MRVDVGDLLLQLHQPRTTPRNLGPHEVDAEIELTPVPIRAGVSGPQVSRQHRIDGGDDVAGLEIATAEAEATTEEVGNLLRRNRIDARMGYVSVVRGIAGPRVLHRLGHTGADLAQQRRIDRQRLIDSLHHHRGAFAAQQSAELVGREGAKHGHVDHADLKPAGAAQIVGHRLGVGDHRPLADDHDVSIVGEVAGSPGVGAAGERRVLGHRSVGELGHMVEEEGTLGSDALSVAVLILHRAEHRRVVDVEQLGNTPSLIPKDQGLGRGRRLDEVRRIA